MIAALLWLAAIIFLSCVHYFMLRKKKMLARKPGGLVHCLACRRYCKIPKGQAGFCGVRVNDNGRFKLTVYGRGRRVHQVGKNLWTGRVLSFKKTL